MRDRAALLKEAYDRGILPPEKKAAYEEAVRRGLLEGRAKDKGMMANIQESAQKRGERLYNIVHGQEGYGASPREKRFQVAMNEVGAVADVIGAGMGAVARGAYQYLPEGAQEALQNIGQKIAPYAQAYEQNKQAYARENPRAAANLEAVREGGALIPLKVAPAGLGAKLSGKVTRKVTSSFRNVVGSPIDLATDIKAGMTKPKISEEGAKQLARQSYKKASEVGGAITLEPEITNNLIEGIKKLAPGSELSEIIIRDKPLTLEAVQEIDEGLGNLIWANTKDGRLTKQGYKLSELQDKFRDSIENASASQIEGGKEGFEALKKARGEWATALRLRDVERILSNAAATDNEATAIKAGFRTLMRNPKKFSKYSGEEKKAIRRAAVDGVVTGTLRTIVGSRLLSTLVGGAQGGVGGAAAGLGLSGAARGAAATIKRGQANKAINIIGKRLAGSKE